MPTIRRRTIGIFLCLKFVLQNCMSDNEADTATADDDDQARDHERVIEYVFADLRGAGAVEAYASQIGRICRQEEVTVARRDE